MLIRARKTCWLAGAAGWPAYAADGGIPFQRELRVHRHPDGDEERRGPDEQIRATKRFVPSWPARGPDGQHVTSHIRDRDLFHGRQLFIEARPSFQRFHSD